MIVNSLNHFKSVFSHKFFVGPADKNYYLAHFCKINGLHEEFYWQASQAIEKYLKATLILNGCSVANVGHDLSKLYSKHLEVLPNDGFRNFVKPDLLKSEFWHGNDVSKFINNVGRYGHPDIRYGLVSWSNDTDDLFKFDQFCFEIRQLTIGMDWIIGADWEDENLKAYYGQPYRKFLLDNKRVQIRSFNVPDGVATASGENLSDIWHAWNFSYMRDNSDLQKHAPISVAPRLGAMSNSYIYLLYRHLFDKRKNVSPYISGGVKWMLANIKFDKETKLAFEKLL